MSNLTNQQDEYILLGWDSLDIDALNAISQAAEEWIKHKSAAHWGSLCDEHEACKSCPMTVIKCKDDIDLCDAVNKGIIIPEEIIELVQYEIDERIISPLIK